MGPLSHIKVLDLTSMVSGPLAATILADQGATVTKVEPLHGEQMRAVGKSHNGCPPIFFSCNRGKRSLALDLKTDDGKDVLWKLIADCDVLMQNFRPGAMARMGFGEDAVREVNEQIIYVSISGFGESGPYSNQRVYDPIIQAVSGMTDVQANLATRDPEMIRFIIADKVASITTAQAVTSALFCRERTGKGQHVKLSMLDAMVSFVWPETMAGYTYEEALNERAGTKLMDMIFPTLDGKITICTVSDGEWRGLCAAMKRDELSDDPRFLTAADREQNRPLQLEIISEELSKWSTDEIIIRLQENDVPSAPLLRRSDLFDNEQIIANETIETLRFEGFGNVRQARPPVRFSETPSAISGPAPKLGEQTRRILSDLGVSAEECERLIASGVVNVSD